MKTFRRTLLWLGVAFFLAAPALAGDIPLIDAHSQLPAPGTAGEVIDLMDKAGVAHTILSFRGQAKGRHVLKLAAAHPLRITAAVKAKGRNWPRGGRKFRKQINKQLAKGKFGALGEVLFYHAAKGIKAPEWSVLSTDEQAKFLLRVARNQAWPVLTHIEFNALGDDKDVWMQRLETLLSQNRDIAFPIMHMGQLEAPDAGRLLAAHPNIYFMTSHANTIVVTRSNQPWIDMFSGGVLKPQWVRLITRYRDRFILNFDNVFEEHWGSYYLDQVALWRKALAALPRDAAHAVAHGNAERLWRLPPVKRN